MAHHLLLRSATCTSFFKPVVSTSPSLCQAIKRYTQSTNEDHAIGVKARSTAEEFTRVAKEKAEERTETVKNTWEDVNKSAGDEPDYEKAKVKYKETIEKGNYDKKGKE